MGKVANEGSICKKCGKPSSGLIPMSSYGNWCCEDCYLEETGYFFSSVSVSSVKVCPHGHELIVEDSPRVGWVFCKECKPDISKNTVTKQLSLWE